MKVQEMTYTARVAKAVPRLRRIEAKCRNRIMERNLGNDACFESHATQPRATLIDNCSGGLVYYRAGGDENEVPNHLATSPCGI